MPPASATIFLVVCTCKSTVTTYCTHLEGTGSLVGKLVNRVGKKRNKKRKTEKFAM
jgi:hypothetical protein